MILAHAFYHHALYLVVSFHDTGLQRVHRNVPNTRQRVQPWIERLLDPHAFGVSCVAAADGHDLDVRSRSRYLGTHFSLEPCTDAHREDHYSHADHNAKYCDEHNGTRQA